MSKKRESKSAKSSVLHLRVTLAESRVIRRAAEAESRTIADYCRVAVVRAAKSRVYEPGVFGDPVADNGG